MTGRIGPLSRLARGLRRFPAVALVLVATVALVGTVFGSGAMSRALDVDSGNIWVWSSKPGEVGRVNANSGRVDLSQPVSDARGHRLRIVQNDKYLLLYDIDTGRITSINLTLMGFTNWINVGKGKDLTLALAGDEAAIIDRGAGTVRGVDPQTLRGVDKRVQLAGKLTGGAFDDDGGLWVGVPTAGTVVRLVFHRHAASVDRTTQVTTPGHDLAVTVLDHGVLAIDRTANRIVLDTGTTVSPVTSPVPLTDATVPDRTVGPLASITIAASHQVVSVSTPDAGRATAFALPAGVDPGTATPFSDHIYVPDQKHHVVLVYDRAGRSAGSLGLAGATGPLDIQVHGTYLMINAPDSSVARVVDTNGVTRVVNKYETDVPGGKGQPALIAAPGAGTSHGPAGAQPADHPGNQGGGHDGPAGVGDPGRSGGDAPAVTPPQQTGPPGPPVPVTAVAGDTTVDLSWPEPAHNGGPITRYTLSWSGGSRTLSGTTHGQHLTGLTNGTSYTFRLNATNKYGDSPDALSEPVTPTSNIPDAPTDVAATADRSVVHVTWHAVSGAASYVVSTGGTVVGTVDSASADIDNLTPGTSYTFTVVARNGSQAGSKPSAESNAVTPYDVPGAVTGLSVSSPDTGSLTVSWGAAPANGRPVTGYTVQKGTDAATSVGTATSKTFTGLSPNTTFTFTVRASNAAGDGPPTQQSGTTQKPAAPVMTMSVTGSTVDSITVRVTVTGSSIQDCTVAILDDSWGCPKGGTGSYTFANLYGSSTYRITGSTHDAYQQSHGFDETGQTTTINATITCHDSPSNPDPKYCSTGIGAYPQPSQSGSGHKEAAGMTIAVKCKVSGQSIQGSPYNEKQSAYWIKQVDNDYVPYAWMTIEGGDDLSRLPTC